MAEISWGTEKTNIARRLNDEELASFNEGMYAKPGRAAIIIKNGFVDEILTDRTQTQASQISWGEKLSRFFKGNKIHVVMVNTAPASLSFRVSVLTLDQQRIDGNGRIWLASVIGENTDKEELKGMSGLFVQDEVNLSDIMNKLSVDFQSRVFEPLVEGIMCDEIRSNASLLEDIKHLACQELGELMLTWGLRIDRISISWNFSIEQKALLAQFDRERFFEEEKAAMQNKHRLQEIQLESELHEKRRRAELELERRSAESELDLREFEMIQQAKRERIKIQQSSSNDGGVENFTFSMFDSTAVNKGDTRSICRNCGQAVSPDWDICPYCVKTLN